MVTDASRARKPTTFGSDVIGDSAQKTVGSGRAFAPSAGPPAGGGEPAPRAACCSAGSVSLLSWSCRARSIEASPRMDQLRCEPARTTGDPPARGWPHVVEADTIDLNRAAYSPRWDRCTRNRPDLPAAQRLVWACGREAGNALANRVGWSRMRCEGAVYDRYDRLLARCFQGNEDLNRWMVAQVGGGLSAVFVELPRRQGAGTAIASRVWSGWFAMPWDWRRGRGSYADQ